ncbi:MAG: tRNA lysidine(34) synthetase TilS [Pseudomonadota bacterium]
MTLEATFATACDRLLGAEFSENIGIAVSGGGDSTALLVLACGRFGGARITALSVDHGLRPEAARELALVATLCAQLGCAHEVLTWQRAEARGNLQAEARAARYALMADWAARTGTRTILLGHTGDDQAETVLMRLARGSGVDGLAAMQPAHHRAGVRWVRPLLETARQDLRTFLLARGTVWSEDPTNDDTRFDRIRLRQMMPALAKIGLDRARLVQTAAHMGRARDVLHEQVRDLAKSAVQQQAGDILIARAAFQAAPDELRSRLLAQALCFVSGHAYRPRFAALSALLQSGTGTLHGALVVSDAKTLRITREAAALRDADCGPDALFDDRWTMIGPMQSNDRVRALGDAGIAQLEDWRSSGLPRASLAASPAIWRDGALIAAPLAHFNPEWRAELVGNRADFFAYLHEL